MKPRHLAAVTPRPDLGNAELRKLVGKRIQRLRRDRNLTQRELADAANIAPNTLGGLEAGTLRTRWDKLVRVARKLETTPEALARPDDLYLSNSHVATHVDPKLLEGLTNEDLKIAQQYHHSTSAVRTHVRHCLTRADIANAPRGDAQIFGRRYDSLSPEMKTSLLHILTHFEEIDAREKERARLQNRREG